MKKLVTALCLIFCAVSAFAAPTITNVLVTATTATTATIQWNTSTPSNSSLKYGTDPSLPYQNSTNPSLVTSHTMTLTLLSAGPYYYVAALSTDNAGTTQSATISFSLCGAPLTPVQGTVTNYYQYGSYTLTWVPPAGASQSPTVCGQPVTTTVTGSLDGGASFNTQVADSSKIVPGPGQWQVVVTDAGNLSPLTIMASLSQVTQSVSDQLQTAAATGGLQACLTNTNTLQSWPTSCGNGQGGGGNPGGNVGSIQYKLDATHFGGADLTGIVLAHTGGVAPTVATGTRNGTGDYQLPTLDNCTGGINCNLVGNTWFFTYSGPAGSGAVNMANANQVGCYPATGTTIGGCPNIYALNPAMNQSQVNALLGGLSGSNTYFIPNGMPQIGYTNPSGQVPHDFRLDADWFQMPGVACDGKESALGIQITQGSNQSSVGALLSAFDTGKTFFFFNKSGFAYGFTQSVWTAKLQSYTFPNATWSANAPFTNAGQQVYYGTDNLTAVNTAMGQANSSFPLTIPTGCTILVGDTIPWNNSQVIVGRHKNAGGFTAPPGKDVIASTDTSGQSISGAGTGLKNIYLAVGTEVDATYPINYYAADGTLTVAPAKYRPGYELSTIANNPCAPGWLIGCTGNGVGAVTDGSGSMTVPAGVTLPVATQAIVFPYLTKVFTTTVSSVNTGTRVVTLGSPVPSGSTQSQAEWFVGTSVQTSTCTIPGTPTYPFTCQLSNPIKPVPGYYSNFAQHGHAKIQDYEFDYMGANTANNQIVIRRGPATVNGGAGYSGTNSIVPLNPCPAKFDNPWPVIPTINSGDSTPSGANFFPGECIGAAGLAEPTANGNVFVGSGLVGGFLEDVQFLGTGQNNTGNANSATAWYIAGNNAPFASHFENLTSNNLQFGIIQGPASYGQHGVRAVGPTGFGNTYHNLWMFGAFDLAFVDTQGTNISGMNMNSTEISPYDGTAVGSATCLQVGFTADEQTGQSVTIAAFDHFDTYGCEPENGSHIEALAAVDIQGSAISFDAANFEGIPNFFGGDHLTCKNCAVDFPTVDYGSNNDFGVIQGSNSGYITNLWDPIHPAFIEWGKNAQCSMFAPGGGGPPVACGASTVQGYQGRGIDPSITGSKPYFLLGGMITPWMWNNNPSLDTNPFTQTGSPDPTATYWGASSQCSLGGGKQCHSSSFNGFGGYVYIGPFNQMYDGPYVLDATFKSVAAASSFLLTIRANDSGTGQCTSGGSSTLYAGTVNTTTSYGPPTQGITVDMTGHAGCVLDVTYSGGSTTDTILTDRFNLVPLPLRILLPLATPTIGTSCNGPNAIIGVNSTTILWCYNGVVTGGSGGPGGGITALTGDGQATGPGSAALSIKAIGSGTAFSTFQGLLQNTFGVVTQATQFDLSGFGKVAQRYMSGVNPVTCSSTPVFDFSLGDTQYMNVNCSVTSSTITNLPPVGYKQHVDFLLCQDGTGGHPVVLPTAIQGITPVTQVANACTNFGVNVTTTASGTTIIADNYNGANCISSASPAACGQATFGEVAIPAGTNPTLQINTSAWQAHSQLIFTPDQTLASDFSGVTCNTAGAAGHYEITGKSVGVDVVITWYGTISTNPLCGTFTVRNQ